MLLLAVVPNCTISALCKCLLLSFLSPSHSHFLNSQLLGLLSSTKPKIIVFNKQYQHVYWFCLPLADMFRYLEFPPNHCINDSLFHTVFSLKVSVSDCNVNFQRPAVFLYIVLEVLCVYHIDQGRELAHLEQSDFCIQTNSLVSPQRHWVSQGYLYLLYPLCDLFKMFLGLQLQFMQTTDGRI